jgi:hypothetical protein
MLFFIVKESIVCVRKDNYKKYIQIFVWKYSTYVTIFNVYICKYKISYLHAKYNGVAPDTFGLLISAPLSSKHCTVWGRKKQLKVKPKKVKQNT